MEELTHAVYLLIVQVAIGTEVEGDAGELHDDATAAAWETETERHTNVRSYWSLNDTVRNTTKRVCVVVFKRFMYVFK